VFSASHVLLECSTAFSHFEVEREERLATSGNISRLLHLTTLIV
jgi:hypothetical protein